MKINKISIGLFATFLALTSCNDYMDVNSNLNDAPASAVLADKIFPGAVSNTFRVHARDLVNLGAFYTNYLGTNSAQYGNGNDEEFSMNMSNGTYSAIWDSTYRGVNNLQQVINQADQNNKYLYYGAMARIMKVYYMQTIVDLFGNIPYSEAFKMQSGLTPVYDKDTDVYKAMFAELDAAIVALGKANTDGSIAEPGTRDIVFNGTSTAKTNWIGFANAVKLRMVVRMSNVTGDTASLRDQQIASLVGKTIIDQDVLVNPGYSNANGDSQNPFTNFFFFGATGVDTQAIAMDTASGHLAICLNSNDKNNSNAFYQKFNGVVDGRKARMFSVTNARVIGVNQGARPGEPDMTIERPISTFGNGWVTASNLTPDQKSVLITQGSSRGGVLMSKTEINMLKAEASLRYPLLGYNGKSSFENAITASFTYLGGSNAPDYITKINTINRLGWVGSNDEKLDAIMTQKWLALGMISPIQVFFDYQRTGYPYTPLAKTAAYPNKPYRLLYPTSELAANSKNVPQVSIAQCFTKNEFTPFWLK